MDAAASSFYTPVPSKNSMSWKMEEDPAEALPGCSCTGCPDEFCGVNFDGTRICGYDIAKKPQYLKEIKSCRRCACQNCRQLVIKCSCALASRRREPEPPSPREPGIGQQGTADERPPPPPPVPRSNDLVEWMPPATDTHVETLTASVSELSRRVADSQATVSGLAQRVQENHGQLLTELSAKVANLSQRVEGNHELLQQVVLNTASLAEQCMINSALMLQRIDAVADRPLAEAAASTSNAADLRVLQ